MRIGGVACGFLALLAWCWEMAIICHDQSIARITGLDQVAESPGLGMFREKGTIQVAGSNSLGVSMSSWWDDSSCDDYKKLAKAIQGFSIICLLLATVVMGVFFAGAFVDGIPSVAGGGAAAGSFLFHLILMAMLAAWWSKSYCGGKVKDYPGMEMSYGFPSYVCNMFIYLLLTVFGFVCAKGAFGGDEAGSTEPIVSSVEAAQPAAANAQPTAWAAAHPDTTRQDPTFVQSAGMTPFQRKKHERVFRMKDFDGNGLMNSDDFQIWGKKFAENMGCEFSEEISKAYKETYDTYIGGEDMSMDAWIVSVGKFYESQGPAILDVCKSINKDKMFKAVASTPKRTSGDLGFDEYFAFVQPLGTTEEAARAGFKIIDKDHSGGLSPDELAEAAARYYLDPEPSRYQHFYGEWNP